MPRPADSAATASSTSASPMPSSMPASTAAAASPGSGVAHAKMRASGAAARTARPVATSNDPNHPTPTDAAARTIASTPCP